jgi:hypothetical protein
LLLWLNLAACYLSPHRCHPFFQHTGINLL